MAAQSQDQATPMSHTQLESATSVRYVAPTVLEEAALTSVTGTPKVTGGA